MSTVLSVTVVGSPKPDWDDLFAFIDQSAELFDYRNQEGPIGQLNTTGTSELPEAVLEVLRISIRIASASGGAFDPTILPLTSLWPFDGGGKLPDSQEISRAKERVNFQEIRIGEDGLVALPSDFGLDLGGIAKGAVVDGLAEYLKQRGYINFLIDAGGDIVVSGVKGDRPWKVGIRHPRKKEEIIAVLSIGDKGRATAVVTSGDYERFFELDGRRYHHILDPETGYPAEGLISVTVIASSCTEADALATAAFVLGLKQGLSFLEKEAGTEGLLIAENGDNLCAAATSGFPIPASELNLD